MAAPYNNIRSKLNRAICAWLVAQGCGGVNDVLPHETRKKRTFPNTTVRATLAQPDPPLTGNYKCQVHISIKGSAVQDTDEPNPEAARDAFDQRVAQTFDALMQSNDGQTLRFTAAGINLAARALAVDSSNGADPEQAKFAANNADMADFTIVSWHELGTGDGEVNAGDGFDWNEILLFEASCCGSNVD